MAETTAARRQPAKLSFTDGVVMVTPKDRDIFFISATKATEALRQAIREEQRVEVFESDFLIPLYAWCVENANRVRSCFLPLPTGSIRVFVVTGVSNFDFELGEKLAALELKLARSGWLVSVAQIPATDGDSLGTFFDPEGALEVYAQRGPAPTEGGE